MPLSDPILASPEDSLQIAQVHVEATIESTISKLARGTADVGDGVKRAAIVFGADIQRPFNRYLVIKDTDTNAIVSYVKWVIPCTKEEAEEESASFKASFKAPPRAEGVNVALNDEFMEKIEILRKDILGDPARLHYLCGNLATLPSHQRLGAAGKLMRWPFEQADKDGVPVYLETDLAGPAISEYKKLGFVIAGEPLTIDLGKYGVGGVHKHIPMIREPKQRED